MLKLCRSDIERGQAGFCTGYILGTIDQAASEFGICVPNNVEYEDVLRAVVRRFEEGSGQPWMRPGATALQAGGKAIPQARFTRRGRLADA
jgi:Rap1a immunity proteins